MELTKRELQIAAAACFAAARGLNDANVTLSAELRALAMKFYLEVN